VRHETLIRALTDIGDDLLLMAQTRTFVNPWKRWGKLAACVALMICLTAISLPYFPVGCGAAEQAPAAEEEAPATEIPAEEAVEEEAPTEEAPMEEMPEQEEAPAEEPDIQEVVSVFFEGNRYELQSGVVEAPEDLGEELGVVEASDGRNLTNCRIYAVLDSEDIYVETPEGLMYAKLTER